MSGSLLIRNARVDGRLCEIRIEAGVIVEIGTGLRGQMPMLDAKGGALLPGLIDHHIHLLATAAEANSLTVNTDTDFAAALRERDHTLAPDLDLRVTGYHDSFHGPLDAARLDALVSGRRVRVQYRTGSLWVLNSKALAVALRDGDIPDCVERNADGVPTGRIWRGDEWLRSRFSASPPSLAAIGRALARQGVTHVTDASASTSDETAALFASAMARNDLRQHLMLMSAYPLSRPANAPWRLGPVKILLDDHALPPLETVMEIVADARRQKRCVAVHCVTAGELAMALAGFDAMGSQPGDRIEHGGIITSEAVAEIKRLDLTVVTQPGFIAERGDHYLREVEPSDHVNLYRCASLIAAGIKTGGSTDAPYTRPDIWAAIAAAIHRTTADGKVLGAGECLSPPRALALFQTDLADPGGTPRRIAVGAPADLALLRDSFDAILVNGFAEPVVATVVAGNIVWGEDRLG
ncbi:MAG: amidohydrolase [Rhodospirillaceae bacterium]|nr:MAG: amidohydrolase [Rhodospirillaceae bacterium]